MLSLNSPKPLSPFHHHHNNSHTSNLHPFLLLNLRTTKHLWKPISAMGAPSSTPPSSNQQVYQPFRPPPSPLPSKYRNLDLQGRLEILRDRLGAWYEYAPLIPSLVQQGFTPSSIEEATGISGVEQNRLIVGAKVRDSLAESNIDAQTLSFFDTGGAELLYEIRLLSVSHRVLAARYMVENRFDARGAQELARAVKDFPRRRGDPGWESFDYSSPADCLAYMYFRQSREYRNPSDQRTLALEKALEAAETENAKKKIVDALKVKSGGADEREGEIAVAIKVPVVRLKMGEVSEASSVVLLPVSKAEEGVKGVVDAPEECRSKGEFGVVAADKEWKRWVVLPGWEPIMGLGSGVVVAFSDARVLPWKVKRWYKEEPILVVADRKKKKVEAEDGFYLITVSNEDGDSNSSNGFKVDEDGDSNSSNGFKVERGSRLTEMGVEECLGSVVLVVRPPKEDIEDQLADEDWE